MIFISFVCCSTFIAHKIVVGALVFQVLLEIASCYFHLFACSTSHLLLWTRFSVSSLLKSLKHGTTSVGTFYDSELAFFEHVSAVVVVGNALQFASVVAARKCCAVEHCFLNRVALVNGLDTLMATFAGGLFWIALARATNNLLASLAIASFNGNEAAIDTQCCCVENGVWSVVERLETTLDTSPIILRGWWISCCRHFV